MTEPDAAAGSSSRRRALAGAVLGAGLALAVAVGLLFWKPGPAHLQDGAAEQDAPGAVRLQALDGRKLGPADYLGKVVVIDFWATWCTPCRLQTQILDEVLGEFGGAEVQFLAVSVAEDEETVRRFVEENPFGYPVLLDSEETLSGPLGIFALPTVMILDRQGRIDYLRSGISTLETLRRAVFTAVEKAA